MHTKQNKYKTDLWLHEYIWTQFVLETWQKQQERRTQLPQTQTLYFCVVLVSGSGVVSKIANPNFRGIFRDMWIFIEIYFNGWNLIYRSWFYKEFVLDSDLYYRWFKNIRRWRYYLEKWSLHSFFTTAPQQTDVASNILLFFYKKKENKTKKIIKYC